MQFQIKSTGLLCNFSSKCRWFFVGCANILLMELYYLLYTNGNFDCVLFVRKDIVKKTRRAHAFFFDPLYMLLFLYFYIIIIIFILLLYLSVPCPDDCTIHAVLVVLSSIHISFPRICSIFAYVFLSLIH